MTRVRGIVRGVLIGVGALVGLAVLFAAFVLFTTPGAKLTLEIANGRDLPFRARSIGGAIANRFTLYGVELTLGPAHATLDTVIVAWKPLALRSHRVEVTEATVAGAHVDINPAAPDSLPPTSPPADSTARWILRAEHLRVRNADIDGPGDLRVRDLDLKGSGGPDEYHAEVRASVSAWRLSDVAAFVRASGNTRAATVDTLDVRTLGGTIRGDAFLRWDPALSWRARLQGDSLRVVELLPPTGERPGQVSFRVASTGMVQDDSTRVVGLDIHALESALRGRPLSARGRVDVDGGRISASRTRIEWGSAGVDLSGSLDDAVADVTLAATVPALGELLPQARGSVSLRGTIKGTPRQLVADVDITGRHVSKGTVELPDFDASLDATASAERYVPHAAEIKRLSVLAAQGRLDARGTVSWRDAITWDGTLAADSVEVSTLTPPRWNLYGPVSLQATTQGTRAGQRLRGSLAIDSLTGRVRERVLDGDGSVALNNDEIDLSSLRIEWGDTRVLADGRIGDTLDVKFDVVAPDLAAIDSSLSGGVSLKGSAGGKRNRPHVIADVTADSLHALTYAARRLEGHIDADLALEKPADVKLLALDVARGETRADTVLVRVSGPRDDQRARLEVAKNDARLELALRGALADTTWSGWIEDVRITHNAAGKWHLRDRAPLSVSRAHVRLDSLDLVSGDARLSARGSWQRGDSTRAAITLSQLPLSTVERYMAEGIQVTGDLNGSATVSIAPDGRVTARLDFVPGPGELILAEKKIAYEGRAAAHADAAGVFARLDLDMRSAGAAVATIDAEMSIPGFVAGRDSAGAQPIEGKIDVDCRNIAPVMAMVEPSLSEASGTLTAHIEPVGTAGNFRWMGRVALEDARVNLRSGLRLRDVDMTLVSDGEGKIALDGAATSGGGRVVVKANSARSEKAWLNGSFTVKGERFQVVNQPEARIFVSPDIDVQVADRVARVTGRVGVPYARIEVAEVPASAVSASGDVVIVEDTLATKLAWQVQTDVNVELGDSVSFAGFGLQAKLAGSLAVHDERGEPTRGTGEIRIVEGKYRAYGNELRIDQGRFIFGGGNIDNPGIDIRASRGLTTQNVMAGSGEVVGVNLRGTLQRPEITLFSNPPMSQSEIMSYLVLGRPLDSSGDQSALASAALLVGMQRGTGVAGDIGKKLSLDEAYIEAGSGMKETSFVAGKYLSPKLYVSYATGLFEKTNTFRVRYSLSRKWTLQAESGKDSSTDLLYWFERGR